MEGKENELSFFPGEQIECSTKCPISRPIPQQKRKSDRQAAQQQQQQAGNSLGGGPGPGGGGRREEEACDNGIMRRTVTELTVDAC